jgi:regulatory protein
MYKQNLTPAQALQKVKHYCAYQERSHAEVKDKLYGLGLAKKDVDELVGVLIEENYLNEERFALAFAGGKFRVKHWGKIKIAHALKQKQVSSYCIKKALQQINDSDYLKTLGELVEEKSKTLRHEKNVFVKEKKLREYALQKGFEAEWVSRVLSKNVD